MALVFTLALIGDISLVLACFVEYKLFVVSIACFLLAAALHDFEPYFIRHGLVVSDQFSSQIPEAPKAPKAENETD